MKDRVFIDGKKYILNIILKDKKHSSGKYNNGVFTLNLSSNISKKERERHINGLLKKLSKNIFKINPLDHLFEKKIMVRKIGYEKYFLGEICLSNEVCYKVYFKRSSLQSITYKKNKDIIIYSSYRNNIEYKNLYTKNIFKYISRDQNHYIENIIDTLNKKFFNKKINKVKLKYTTSVWGSCTSKNNINISIKLLFLPFPLLEYVCIHELAHLIERNHSKKFWDIVENIIPDYKEKEKMLKNY